jgi:hypothetical protein
LEGVEVGGTLVLVGEDVFVDARVGVGGTLVFVGVGGTLVLVGVGVLVFVGVGVGGTLVLVGVGVLVFVGVGVGSTFVLVGVGVDVGIGGTFVEVEETAGLIVNENQVSPSA